MFQANSLGVFDSMQTRFIWVLAILGILAGLPMVTALSDNMKVQVIDSTSTRQDLKTISTATVCVVPLTGTERTQCKSTQGGAAVFALPEGPYAMSIYAPGYLGTMTWFRKNQDIQTKFVMLKKKSDKE